jgi:hypothetical protein
MQFAQRPGGAYALNVNPHFPQTRVSAIELVVAFRFCYLRISSSRRMENVTNFLTADDRDQVTQFIVHVLRISHGVATPSARVHDSDARRDARHPRGALT